MSEHQNPESLDKAAAKHEAIAKELRLQAEKTRNPVVPVSRPIQKPSEQPKPKRARFTPSQICAEPITKEQRKKLTCDKD